MILAGSVRREVEGRVTSRHFASSRAGKTLMADVAAPQARAECARRLHIAAREERGCG